MLLCFFFFQAEDGIRDVAVTGVQTCALPICACTMPLATASQAVMPPKTFTNTLLTAGSDRMMCRDRKSTRLNSSHGYISYAVFCLKKKKKKNNKKDRVALDITRSRCTRSER